MLIQLLIDLGFGILHFFLSLLPNFQWSVVSSSWTAAKSILDGICYFLPLSTVTTIISLIFGLVFIRVAISFIKFVLSFIPFF